MPDLEDVIIDLLPRKGKSLTLSEADVIVKQIRQDHEVAKEHNDLMKANSEIVQHNIDITKDRQIVKRLEERQKECEKFDLSDDACRQFPDVKPDRFLRDELQKILEGKK